MKAPTAAPLAPLQAHVAIVTGDVRGAAEEHTVAGFTASCGTMGLSTCASIAEDRPASAALTVLFTGSPDSVDRPTDPTTIVFPFMRSPTELPQWRARLADRVVWTASADLAAKLDDGRRRAVPIGVCHAAGAPDHRSRRAFALRENDTVFGCRATRFDGAEEQALRAAIATRIGDAARPFARVSHAIDLSDCDVAQRAAWRDWARQQPDDGIVLLEGLDIRSSKAFVDLCDHWIVTRDTAWFPWWTTLAVARGKTTLVLDFDAPAGADEPATVRRLAADTAAASLAAHVTALTDAARPAARLVANPTSALHGARTVGCRIVAALRNAGLWERLLWSKVR